jgi:endoglucanase
MTRILICIAAMISIFAPVAPVLATPTNVLAGKAATSNGSITNGAYLTNGDKTSANYTSVSGTGALWIQFDLGQSYNVSQVNLWHYFADGRRYHDVIVKLSTTADFSAGVTTVFNNDTDNSAGVGAGSDAEYAETASGKTIAFNPVTARYVKLWTNGNTVNTYDHYVEVEVYAETGATATPTARATATVTSTATATTTARPTATARTTATRTATATATARATATTAAVVHLRVNQLGYLPTDTKTALAITNASLSGQSFTVRDANGTTAFTGTVGADRGALGSFAHVYELPFSGLQTTGTGYKVAINGNTSPAFAIDSQVYAGLISLSLDFYDVQRCGDTAPAAHGVCHMHDQNVGGRDYSGGWHDAADYIKFSLTSGFAADMMLTAYDQRPSRFIDPQNPNALPKVLAENKVALDWMLKMWDSASQKLYYQVDDSNDHDLGWFWGGSDTSGTPRWPEDDDVLRNYTTSPRIVYACESGKGGNIAGKFAAALALGYKAWNDPSKAYYNPGLASAYLTAARQIFAWGSATDARATTPQYSTNGYYDESHATEDMALGAAELYHVTGEASFLTAARRYADMIGDYSGLSQLSWSRNFAVANYEIARFDPTYKATAAARLKAHLTKAQANAADYSIPAGWPFRVGVNMLDWGSNIKIVLVGQEALLYENLTGDTAYHALAQDQRDYIFGVNPWGLSFVNSTGTAWPHHPRHRVTYHNQQGPVPTFELRGFWTAGGYEKKAWDQEHLSLDPNQPSPYNAFNTASAVYYDNRMDYVTNEATVSLNGAGVAFAAWLMP